MTAKFGADVRASLIRLKTTAAQLTALLFMCLSLSSSSWAQALPCANGSLPTGDSNPNYSQQLIQVCIPPVGWNGQLVIYVHGFVPPQMPIALPTQELAAFGPDLIAAVLQNGFAFATTSFRKNGYAIQQ